MICNKTQSAMLSKRQCPDSLAKNGIVVTLFFVLRVAVQYTAEGILNFKVGEWFPIIKWHDLSLEKPRSDFSKEHQCECYTAYYGENAYSISASANPAYKENI